ncbi:hypothetical protein CRENPOLYSF2_4090005 [Crenothrix polyspora]|uniref:Uncharacterized protein n=1 Tax=Crenothrix polyspora TaxID=360316 RepID=A0A1R4HFA1_9GAMM|nr:hypothetical protein CRENPOLYSF2_4090005 [Crenothrix polyspora]
MRSEVAYSDFITLSRTAFQRGLAYLVVVGDLDFIDLRIFPVLIFTRLTVLYGKNQHNNKADQWH